MKIDNKVREALLAAKSDTDVLQIMAKETRRLKVLEIHRNSIQEWVDKKNGKEYHSFATRLPDGKRVRAKTYEMLIDKLYDFYYMEKDLSLSAVWEDAKANAVGLKTATLRRYQSTWATYFANTRISQMSFKQLSKEDWETHYAEIVAKHKMVKKQVSAARDVVSMIYKHAIRNKIVSYNPTRDILYGDLPVRKSPSYNSVKVKPFTGDEAKKITDWCKEKVRKAKSPSYWWAIVINLVLGLRVGELCALKWSDVDFEKRTIIVRRQKVKDYEYDDGELSYVGYVESDNLKGCEEHRTLAITDGVADALENIRALGLDGELVFPVFRYKTYNKKIKEAAEAIGLVGKEYRTHSLRATAATVLYLATKNIYAVQYLLGHTTVEMTLKYIKDMEKTENLRAAMLSDSLLSLSSRFEPLNQAISGDEKTPETLDFTGFPRSQMVMEHRGFEPLAS